MDCAGRLNTAAVRDTESGEEMSPEDHTDDEMHDCDSADNEQHVTQSALRLNGLTASNGVDMSYSVRLAGTVRPPSPDHANLMKISHQQNIYHQHQFPPNHPLNALGNFMGIGGLHNIPNLQQHNDVLEKLKMQVRDMKVGLMEHDYINHGPTMGSNVLPTSINTAFTIPTTTMASFGHEAAANSNNNNALAGNSANVRINTATMATVPNTSSMANGCGSSSNGNFSFTSPNAPNSKDVNPASNSSTSSDASNSPQQSNGWSFEEQYKQVRQLYEINDDPGRKEFLDDLFSFMQSRGTPINRLPIMAKSVLDLYELYNLVIARGGLVDVINKKLWQEIIKGLHLPSSITSAAFTLRTQYMKYLYPYECDKKNLSTPIELQAAIDGNRREGRRSSYGQYDTMHHQIPMQQLSRQALQSSIQQMSPLALVTHAAATNTQQAQAVAAAAAAHHRLIAPTFGQVTSAMSQEIEQRMIGYLKLLQADKEQQSAAASSVAISNSSANVSALSPRDQQHQHQQQQSPGSQYLRSQSADISPREALNVAIWQLCHSNSNLPAAMNIPQLDINNDPTNAVHNLQQHRNEALNLSDISQNLNVIKREREPRISPHQLEHADHQPPPNKRAGFDSEFYLPTNIDDIARANGANFHCKSSDNECPEKHNDDGEEDGELVNEHYERPTNKNSSHTNSKNEHQINRMPARLENLQSSENHTHQDKSDDSAIEHSPNTWVTSPSNPEISPVSSKKGHFLKKPQQTDGDSNEDCHGTSSGGHSASNAIQALSLLSGMQFQITRSGANNREELMVKLDLNGVTYSGVLKANSKQNARYSNTSNNSNAGDSNNSSCNTNGGIHDVDNRNENKNVDNSDASLNGRTTNNQPLNLESMGVSEPVSNVETSATEMSLCTEENSATVKKENTAFSSNSTSGSAPSNDSFITS